MTTRYGFHIDRDAEGSFYVKLHEQNGQMLSPIPDVAQDYRRFATPQEARAAAMRWETEANRSERLRVCNPQYQERRLDGVWAHLEYDPKHGTVLVRDRDCRERIALDAIGSLISDAAEAVERFDEDELERYAAEHAAR